MGNKPRSKTTEIVKKSTSPSVASKIKDGGGLILRSAIAAVPVLGGSISVIVENRLSEKQTIRIDDLYNRLHELNTQLEARDGLTAIDEISEPLLEFATRSAIRAHDDHRPKIIANLLFDLDGTDPNEIVRRVLIEIASSLTLYELSILVSYSNSSEISQKTSTFQKILLNLHLDNPTLSELRGFSQNRLETFKLIVITDGGPVLTQIGHKLVSAL